jgi:hypothetical protein
MNTILSSIFRREHSEIVAFLNNLMDADHWKIASSFMLTQNIAEKSGDYTMVAQLETGLTLLTRGAGHAEIKNIQPLQLEGVSVMPVVRIDKGRFVNSKELVLSPLHMTVLHGYISGRNSPFPMI